MSLGKTHSRNTCVSIEMGLRGGQRMGGGKNPWGGRSAAGLVHALAPLNSSPITTPKRTEIKAAT